MFDRAGEEGVCIIIFVLQGRYINGLQYLLYQIMVLILDGNPEHVM